MGNKCVTHITNKDSRAWSGDVIDEEGKHHPFSIAVGQTYKIEDLTTKWLSISIHGGEKLAGPADQSFIICSGGRLEFAKHGTLQQRSNDPVKMGCPTVLNAILTEPRHDAVGNSLNARFVVMSLNYQSHYQSKGQNHDARCAAAGAYINSVGPAVVCLQEPMLYDLQGIHHALEMNGRDYSAFYCGRTKDGSNEASPILVSRRYLVVDGGMMFLSPDGCCGKMCTDQGCERHATWIVMRAPNADDRLLVMNLHLDNWSQEANARMVRECVLPLIEQMAKQVSHVVIAGDLNGSLDGDTAKSILEAGFKSADPGHMLRNTFVGWPAFGDHTSGYAAIDHIFYRGLSQVGELQHLPHSMHGGVQISDHVPIHVEFAWQ